MPALQVPYLQDLRIAAAELEDAVLGRLDRNVVRRIAARLLIVVKIVLVFRQQVCAHRRCRVIGLKRDLIYSFENRYIKISRNLT